MKTKVRVLRGLEITVEFEIEPAQPSVGIMNRYVSDWRITEIAGRPLGKSEACEWLYKRISHEEDKILEACLQEAF